MSAFSFNRKVVDEDYGLKFDCQINKSIQKLIESCWSKNPKERHTFEQLFKKLAFIISDMNDKVYVDIEESEIDEEPDNYFLDNVDVDEVITYANEIDGPMKPGSDGKELGSKSNNNSIIEIIEKVINPLIKENDELKKQIANIQKEREYLLSEMKIMKNLNKKRI